jgi:hypothetical protein
MERFGANEMVRLVRAISGFTKTKRRCGAMLNIFCGHLIPHEIVGFIVNLLYYETMEELDGPIDQLLDELTSLNAAQKQEIKSNFKINKDGNLAESDADEEGNLKYAGILMLMLMTWRAMHIYIYISLF